MAIYSIWNKCFQQRSSTSASNNNQQCGGDSNGRNRRNSYKFRNWIELQQFKLYNNRSRKIISVHDDLSRSWHNKPDCDPENNRGYQRNRHYKYLYPIIGLLIASPVSAADVEVSLRLLIQSQTVLAR